ncbi:hypothetical protein PV08_05527 [Exophiala spinifera]|uniref:SET domain-containing protein n=1 Tax=Exophiala spinifera TaxID=91928 RepID=A0A0D1YKI2_9EURO|nr:uncharacterized protein PV08_05527 [Exophiala spinifera]KIW15481.1 hypothetical protein PV08_05527 [Exophiala spinifera]
MRSRRQRSMFQVICICFSLFALTPPVAADDDALYQVDPDQLFQSVKLDLQGDPSDSDSYSPWSYRPFCTDTLFDKINDEPLCVYTSTGFAGGRGLSLFTTPSVADHIVATTPLFSEHDTSVVSSGVNTHSGNWYTAPIPGKGTGMLASKALRRGNLVLATTPILIAYSENVLDATTREKYLRRAIDQLPSVTRAMYLSLASLSDNAETQVQDIAAANTFGISLGSERDREGEQRPHLAVFPEASRMNHDCAPNAIFHIDTRTLTQHVHAVRSVAASEELSIAYTSPLDSTAERQAYLRRSFGFQCSCSRCRRGKDNADADADSNSDLVLSEMATLQSILGDWSPASKASVSHAERLVSLYVQEGLQGYMDPAYCHAALVYGSVGSARGVKKYVDLAVRAIELRLGPDNEDIKVWKEMAAAPEKHWSWRRRKQK